MKKSLLLFALFAGMVMTASAQFPTNKTATDVGFDGQEKLANGNYRCGFSFNLSSKFVGNYGFSKKVTCNGPKGIYTQVLNDKGSNNTYINKFVSSFGSGIGTMYHFPSIAAFMDSVTVNKTTPWDANNQWFKSQTMLIDVAEGDQALALYPGMYKNSSISFYLKRDALFATPFTFDILKAAAGTSGAVTPVKLIVEFDSYWNKEDINSAFDATRMGDLDTLTSANVKTMFPKGNVYVCDNIFSADTAAVGAKTTIDPLAKCGLNLDTLNNHAYTYFILYAGNNATALDPRVTNDVLAIDNAYFEYTKPTWKVAGTDSVLEANAYIKDTIYAHRGDVVNLTLKINGYNRLNQCKFTKDTYGKAAKLIQFCGDSTILSYNSATSKYDLKVATANSNGKEYDIAASKTGVVNDQLLINLTADLSAFKTAFGADSVYTVWDNYELDNGTRIFWQPVIIVSDPTATGVSSANNNNFSITTDKNVIFVKGSESDVRISTMDGALVADTSAGIAAKGITVKNGAYIVKTGKVTRKVLVK